MNGINLNEFVTLAITEIAKGVSEAEAQPITQLRAVFGFRFP